MSQSLLCWWVLWKNRALEIESWPSADILEGQGLWILILWFTNCARCFYVNSISSSLFRRGSLNWENACMVLDCRQAYATFSWLMTDVGGSNSRVQYHPWAGSPGCYKKAGWVDHKEQLVRSSPPWPLLQFLPELLPWLSGWWNTTVAEMKPSSRVALVMVVYYSSRNLRCWVCRVLCEVSVFVALTTISARTCQ